jgi:hypothetical protein
MSATPSNSGRLSNPGPGAAAPVAVHRDDLRGDPSRSSRLDGNSADMPWCLAASSPDRISRYRYWPVVSLSVLDTRTDTTLARLTTTPFSADSRSYLARINTRLRRSSSARAIASIAATSPSKSVLIRETSSPHRVKPHDQFNIVRHGRHLPSHFRSPGLSDGAGRQTSDAVALGRHAVVLRRHGHGRRSAANRGGLGQRTS